MTDKPLLGRHDAVPRRRWRWLLPTLLAVGAIALVGSLIVRLLDDDDGTSAPKAALDSYLEAVETNATIRAYGMLCGALGKPTQTEYEQAVGAERKNFGGVVRHRLGEARRLDDGDVAVTYTVQYKQTYRWYSARLRDERGVWKVCGFKEIPRPEVRLPANQIPEPPDFVDTGTTTTTR